VTAVHDSSTTPDAAVAPEAISHVVLNVSDLERAEQFYSGVLGFRRVGEIERLRMRFYAGSGGNHHDLALMEVPGADAPAERTGIQLAKPRRLGLNHIAIRWPSEAALFALHRRLAGLGVPVDLRIDHGMSRSLYTTDPDGNGLELMCDLPRDRWEDDINRALNEVHVLPTAPADGA
jgi:catechol-2,3-dioxygenase